MNGYTIRHKPDGEKEFVCRCCGRSHDCPFPVCPDCGNAAESGRNEKGGDV